MKRKYAVFLLPLFIFCASYAQNIKLSGWKIKNSSEVRVRSTIVSSLSFTPSGWYDANVPATVLATLVRNGVYPDPRTGLNNYKIPDMSYAFNLRNGLGKYSYLCGGRNPWADPYWYRTEIFIPRNYKGKHVWLTFNGINYRAEVWINGRMAAGRDSVAGMFRRFRLDVTGYVTAGQKNCIAVKVYGPDHPGTPSPGTQFNVFGPPRGNSADLFKDVTMKMSGGWDCAPVVRDRNTGIWQDVLLSCSGDVIMDRPYVVTLLPCGDTSLASLSVSVRVKNLSDKEINTSVGVKISLLNDIKFPSYTRHMEGYMKPVVISKRVHLAPRRSALILFSPRDYPQLLIRHPHLWYPNGYGEQYLHNVDIKAYAGRKLSDEKNFDFGMREVKSGFKNKEGEYGRIFYVNGTKIFCKGGWIQPDMLLEDSDKRIYDQARLIAEANINLVGSEDMPAPPDTWLESFDKYGIMWWHVFYQCYRMYPGTDTEHNPQDHDLALACARDEMYRYRNHPCVTAWFAANEVLPDSDLYMRTKNMVCSIDSTRPFVPTTSISWDVDKLTPYVKNDLPLGTTDDGAPDYGWAPSGYFFDKVEQVHLQMFRNELGMPSVPVYESLKKFIPSACDSSGAFTPYFPLDSTWAEHGAWDVDNYCYRSYDNAVRTLYGDPKSVREYADHAQFVSAEGYRAMFEAANHSMWDITSGIMIWKLNSCWPDVGWQIYDWYLAPCASYFFTKKALEPVHVQLNANDMSVSVINTTGRALKDAEVSVKVIGDSLKTLWSCTRRVSADASSCMKVAEVPDSGKFSYNYFVVLKICDAAGKVVSDNLYWRYSQHVAFEMPALMHGTSPESHVEAEKRQGEFILKIRLHNTSAGLSFFNRMALSDPATGEEINPVFWSDNFVTLFPGEEKIITAKVAVSDARGEVPDLKLESPE
ncbi:MAG: glycoside hydrolase family 2 [Bacteroidales bacterium]|jgi:hypothetical protein|nr:glycoside hydrolase family 2 [Bacteroidales bacterium]